MEYGRPRPLQYPDYQASVNWKMVLPATLQRPGTGALRQAADGWRILGNARLVFELVNTDILLLTWRALLARLGQSHMRDATGRWRDPPSLKLWRDKLEDRCSLT